MYFFGPGFSQGKTTRIFIIQQLAISAARESLIMIHVIVQPWFEQNLAVIACQSIGMMLMPPVTDCLAYPRLDTGNLPYGGLSGIDLQGGVENIKVIRETAADGAKIIAFPQSLYPKAFQSVPLQSRSPMKSMGQAPTVYKFLPN